MELKILKKMNVKNLKTEPFWKKYDSNMTADALAPCVASCGFNYVG